MTPGSLRVSEIFHSETRWLRKAAGRWAESGVWPKVFRDPVRGQAANIQEEGGLWKGGRGLVFTSLLPNQRSARWGLAHMGSPQASLTLWVGPAQWGNLDGEPSQIGILVRNGDQLSSDALQSERCPGCKTRP